jgi:phosphoglycerate dehydrogenase-like enzyme
MKAVLYTFQADDPVHRFRDDFPQLKWALAASPLDVAREIGDAHILVITNRVCTPEFGEVLRRAAPASLGWVHFLTSGVERGLAMGLPPHAAVSNASALKARTVAEHAVTLLLALMRRLPDLQAAQRAHAWRRVELQPRLSSLERATICIVGLGGVGREVARKAKAFDARTIAVSRAGTAGGDVDRVLPRERIAEALAEADAVAICARSDASSRRMIGAAQFAAMRHGAYLVNIARGEILDEAALVTALREGRLAGAALDVTEVEPLPADSALWDMPNVIISPHVAGAGAEDYEQQKALFSANLERYRAGAPLLNQITPAPALPQVRP